MLVDDRTLRNVDDVRFAKEQLSFLIDAFLHRKGWSHTSSTPGCFWLWERTIDGRRVLVDRDLALSMQASIETAESFVEAVDEALREVDS